jgi:methyl-accepting chemotaxis protein
MNLDEAVQKHNDWKVNFRGAITKQETMDVATISKDNCCDFEKWLHGEGKSKFGGLSSFTECLAKHKVFHVEAGKVATAINAKKFAEASAMIGGGSAYSAASSDTGVAIMRLKKEAAL